MNIDTPPALFKSDSSKSNSENVKNTNVFDLTEWGHVDSIPIFISKCETLNVNLLKAIAKFDQIYKQKHSTMEDVEYLKKLEIDFRIFSFIPIARKINKRESDSYENLDLGMFFNLLILVIRFFRFFSFKRKRKPIYYYSDEEVKLNDEKRLLYKNLITKYLNESMVSFCNFFDNQKSYKWDDKRNEIRSIIILNLEGYKFLNDFSEKLYRFFICLPFHILDEYTPKSFGFGFKERRSVAENEPDLLKRKEIYAEGLAMLEMSVLGTEGKCFAFNMKEYPENKLLYKKAIEILEERIKHTAVSEVSKSQMKLEQSAKFSTSNLEEFLSNKTNIGLFLEIQRNFKNLEGKWLAILIYLLQEEFKIISIISNSKTLSRKQFILLFKEDSTFDKLQAVNKYIDSYTNELNLPTLKESDADYIYIKEKLTKILDNSVS